MPTAKKKTIVSKKAPAKKVVAKSKQKSGAASKPAAKPSNVTVLKMARPTLVSTTLNAAERIPPRVQAMIDKTEIAELLATLARGLDRLDETLLRSVLHADATLDLGPGAFQGNGNDYVQWILAVFNGVKSTHHMISNIRVELEGDVALVESYFNAHVRVDKPVGREDVFMGGRYLDRMERRPTGNGVWKIIHRKQILDWVRTEAVSDIFYHQNPDALWSYRTKTDPSYQMAQFPGSQATGKLPAFLGRRYESKSIKF